MELNSRKGKRCCIYIRVSSERQVEGFSLDGQKRYLSEWAAFEGMEVAGIYVEEGKSGKSIDGRDEFQRMLSDIASGMIQVNFVVVFKLSRFGRNAKDILNSLSYIQSYGVNLICKEDGLDSSTNMGRMMITILGAVAEMERENILAQTYLGREEKARQGGWNGGFAPYGYILNKENGAGNGFLEIDEKTAPTVKMIFEKFVNENMGYSTIAGYLNKQGVPKLPNKNSHGREFTDWDTMQVKRILKNPLYAGKIAFGRTRTQKVAGTENEYRRVLSDSYILSERETHTPIVSQELFDMAQKKIGEPKVKGNPHIGRTNKHLLSGLLRCPMCGSSMYAEVRKWINKDGSEHTVVNYQCGHYAKAKHGQCKKNAIRAEWIESEVIAYTKLLVQNPQFAADIQRRITSKMDYSGIECEIRNYREHLEGLERSKSNLERDIDNVTGKYAERKREDLNRRLDKLYEEIYETEDRISDCELRMESAKKEAYTQDNIYQILLAFDKFIDIMDQEDKRKMVECLISEIQLYPKETWKEGQSPVKYIKYTFPVTNEVRQSLGERYQPLRRYVYCPNFMQTNISRLSFRWTSLI